MNANELADKLMSSLTMEYDCDEYMKQAATMLRQQQAEIEALRSLSLRKENLGYFYDLHTIQQAEIEVLKKQVIGDDYVFVCKRCGDELGIKFEEQEK